MGRGRGIPPLGSFSAGNMSLPQMDQAATAVTMPVKARKAFCEDRSSLVTLGERG